MSSKYKLELILLNKIFFINILFFSILFNFYTPKWDTNDDVAMSMILHGYGFGKIPSTNLIFSNVIWGEIINLIPNINGVYAYSIATMMALFMIANFIIYFLIKLEVNFIIACLITFLILLRPIVFPQFTLNSGLLAASFILSILYYKKSNSSLTLIFSGLLFILAFLIRFQELLLVIFVSIPFVKFNFYINDNKFKIYFFILLLLVIVFSLVDINSYQNDQWKNFMSVNSARIPYTDHGLAKIAIKSPEVLNQLGFTKNDILLIANWFFSDSTIYDANKLNSITSKVEFTNFIVSNFDKTFVTFYQLVPFKNFPFLIIIFISLILKPNLKLIIVCILIILSNFLLTLMGRGGLDRVTFPLISIATLFSIININMLLNKEIIYLNKIKYKNILPLFLISFVFLINTKIINEEARIIESKIKEINAILSKFPNQTLYSWGATLRIEYIYPLFDNNIKKIINIYGLGVFTLAPNTLSFFQENNNDGFIKNIRSENGLIIFANPSQLNMLNTWCFERFGEKLTQKNVQITSKINYHHVKCN